MRDLDVFIRSSRDMLQRGGSIEEVIAKLRRDGCSVIESIKILTEAVGMDIRSAKRAVHLSATWSDRLDAHEAFHDQLEEAAREESTAENAGKPSP